MITGENDREHSNALADVFQRLSVAGPKLKGEKYSFMKNKIKYLGHEISISGLSKSNDRIKAVLSAEIPKDVAQVRSFVGMANHYSKLIKNLGAKMRPIYDLLKRDTWATGHSMK